MTVQEDARDTHTHTHWIMTQGQWLLGVLGGAPFVAIVDGPAGQLSAQLEVWLNAERRAVRELQRGAAQAGRGAAAR